LPGHRLSRLNLPSGYWQDFGLRDAVNGALLPGQPLLVTGEPGTGKTQLAYSVAWELGFDPPLKFETKSTSTAHDLFYTYDTLTRFHAAQTGEGSQSGLDYITYNALGLAIIRANEKARVKPWLPEGFDHGGCRQSVVLIDEIDKAPRDFPNDMLNELEEMYFKILELGNVKIAADESMRPIVIITSNSEKHLPDAFLRRCIYYDIPFPNEENTRRIVETRIGQFVGNSSPLLSDALDFYYQLRTPGSGLRKKPATAELLGWLTALQGMGVEVENRLRQNPEGMKRSLNTLIKTAEDQKQAVAILDSWLKNE